MSGRNWLLPLLVLTAEVCWFYPWLIWLGRLPIYGEHVSLSPVSVLVLIGGAYLATRLVLSRKWRPVWAQVAVVIIGLVVIFLVLRIEYGAGYGVFSGEWFGFISRNLLGLFSFMHSTYLQPVMVALGASLYLWWRGIRLGRSAFTFDNVYFAFVMGAVALVVLGIFWDLSQVYGKLGSMLAVAGVWVAGFFALGLMSLALGNFHVIRQKMAGLEGASPLFGRRWLALLVSLVVIIVLVGVGLASLFSTDTAAVLGHWLSLAGNGLLWLFYYVLVIPVGFVLQGLAYVWHFLQSIFSGGQIPPPTSLNITAPEPPPTTEPGVPGAISPIWLAVKWVGLALLAAAIVYLFVRAMRRAWSARPKDEVEEVHESLWSWTLFRGDLHLFWEGLRRRFTRKRRPPAEVPLEFLVQEEEAIPDYPDVRAIYHRLLREGEVAGFPRRTGETPAEYARRLGRAVSEGKEELGYLTELYQRARYGEAATPSGMLAQANRLFKALYQRLRALREMVGM